MRLTSGFAPVLLFERGTGDVPLLCVSLSRSPTPVCNQSHFIQKTKEEGPQDPPISILSSFDFETHQKRVFRAPPFDSFWGLCIPRIQALSCHLGKPLLLSSKFFFSSCFAIFLVGFCWSMNGFDSLFSWFLLQTHGYFLFMWAFFSPASMVVLSWKKWQGYCWFLFFFACIKVGSLGQVLISLGFVFTWFGLGKGFGKMGFAPCYQMVVSFREIGLIGGKVHG